MYKRYIKRSLDIIIAIIGLPILAVILIGVSLLIKITDKGPIFYNAYRIGKYGKLFKMYKFRSMKVNSPDIRLNDGSTYNSESDLRVTKIGKFLRKTSLDEAPQILNVLIGDMSIIGPRPDPPDWLDRYPDDVKVFLSVRPGITGYNQAYFRNSADGEEKMKNDVFYALNYTFILDFKIFIKTITIVFKGEKTYKDIDNKRPKYFDDNINQDNARENISA